LLVWVETSIFSSEIVAALSLLKPIVFPVGFEGVGDVGGFKSGYCKQNQLEDKHGLKNNFNMSKIRTTFRCIKRKIRA
jgi:hypothetical protein